MIEKIIQLKYSSIIVVKEKPPFPLGDLISNNSLWRYGINAIARVDIASHIICMMMKNLML